MIYNILAVFIGGGIGSVLRYLTSIFCMRVLNTTLPMATFSVNILGSFIIGLTVSYFLHKTGLSQTYKLFITVGFCGGLSTFSTFSIEILIMLKQGNYFYSAIYTILTIIACFTAALIGLKVGKIV